MIKKQKIQQIVNCFETGSAEGNYGDVSIFNDGPNKIRQLTYSKAQTTEYGHLPELLKQYVANKGLYAKEIAVKIPTLTKGAVNDKDFISLLKKGGSDPVMRNTADTFFDLAYWNPAMKWADTSGLKENLSLLVIYDSFIHSGSILQLLRKRFSAVLPTAGGDEKTWITQYLDARHQWLKYHSNPILRNTIYRTTDMKRALAANDWNLDLPFHANGVTVV